MKRLILFLLLTTLSYSQSYYKITETNFKKLAGISVDIANKVKLVEHSLEKNQSNLNVNKLDINDPYVQLIVSPFSKLSPKTQNKISELVCISCYEKCWENQLQVKEKILFNRKKEKDSVENIRIALFNKETQKKDSVSRLNVNKVKGESSKEANPYDLLDRSLYAFSKTNRSLAVFRKLDYNYAAPKLSSYLQSEMKMASKDFVVTTSTMTETFVPKVSDGSEYLKVKYNITKRNDIVGIYDTAEVGVINSVEIIGTPDLIIRLFLNYWPQKIKLSGYKKGVIAYQDLLSDRISIYGVSPGLYKIEIGAGNMDLNYETTYGINRKK